MLFAALCFAIKEACKLFLMATVDRKNGGLVDTAAGERIGGPGDGVSGEIFFSFSFFVLYFGIFLSSVSDVNFILWVELVEKLNLGLS